MHTPSYHDIIGQAPSLRRTAELVSAVDLDGLSSRQPFVFIGCGASYHAATVAAGLLCALGETPAVAVPASDLWMNPDVWLRPGSVVVGLSRTGTTTETVAALRTAKAHGAATVGITLTPGSELATDTDHTVLLDHVGEQGRVMTRSFANLLLAAQLVAIRVSAAAGGRDPALVAEYADATFTLAERVAHAIDGFDREAQTLAAAGSSHLVFLGSGPDIGLCRQAALQAQETARSAVEAHTVLDYRHGPLAALTPDSVLVMLTSTRSLAADLVVAGDVATLGGTLIAVGPEPAVSRFPGHVRRIVAPDSPSLWLQGNLALPFLQLFAYHLTLQRGADPESVHNLDRTKEPHVNPHVLPDGMFMPVP